MNGIGLLGQKVGMTQVYTKTGRSVPVTVIAAGPCPVLQLKTKETDSYEAVQLGYKNKPRRLASRSVRGHVANIESKRAKAAQAAGAELSKKANCEPQTFVREFRVATTGMEVGQVFDVNVFQDVPSVDVTAVCKGRGYSGTMKRHNFSGQRATHGVKKCHRHAGSTGCSSYPSRVQKGLKSSGQYGNVQCTIRNIQIVKADKENNLLLIYGAVPGPNGGYVQVFPSNRLPKSKPFPDELVNNSAE